MWNAISNWYKRLTGIHISGGGPINQVVGEAAVLPWWRANVIYFKDGVYYPIGEVTIPANIDIHITNGYFSSEPVDK